MYLPKWIQHIVMLGHHRWVIYSLAGWIGHGRFSCILPNQCWLPGKFVLGCKWSDSSVLSLLGIPWETRWTTPAYSSQIYESNRNPVLGYKFVVMTFITHLAPVFKLISHLLIILPIHGWAPCTTKMMVVKVMFQDCLQRIIEVFVWVSSVFQDGLVHVTLETFGFCAGAGAPQRAFWSSAKSKYRTCISLHLVVRVCKEDNNLVKNMQSSVIFFAVVC